MLVHFAITNVKKLFDCKHVLVNGEINMTLS